MLTDEQLQPIAQLIDQYERLSEADRRRYSETETRTNFIDRLFLALGWPVYDRAHVERETTVAEGKRPDYIFKLHAVPRLFLEAKPLRDDIYNLEYARDAITKAYNKGVPWAGVTNFANLVIFDAQEELATGAHPRRVLDLAYKDYLRPDAGLHLLTRDALDQRLLDEQAQRTGTRPRAVPIEKRLYESMRQWRELLFNHMRAALDWKTDAQLRTGDEAIQRLIDRLIFLRNCEDRDIGTTDLRALLHRIRSRDRNVRVTQSLLRLFAEAAATYDSELFQTDALIDVLLQGLATRTDVDDTLAEIVEGLYSVPRSYAQYDFAQMDADVLGQVYEQYLGYVPQYMRALAAQEPLPGQPARDITVDAKRQRRKEHGIYYTPRWVVHYIVQQTLGRYLEENSNRPDAIDNVTILDPACGSGSFLIRAYETLLEHHAATMGGDVGHVDSVTRQRILRRNIFGVDVDPQAVEIARLNLLIRMVRQQEQLPPLADNIQHGNSLIEGDGDSLRPFFGDAWQDKRPFDWQREFHQVMERGGFDIVIGNPPYVQIQTIDKREKAYFRIGAKYASARGSYDLYVLFVERALQLLRPGGYLGFITSGKFLRTSYGEHLCRLLHDKAAVLQIIDLAGHAVFEGATNYPTILVATKDGHRGSFVYVPTGAVAKGIETSEHLASARQVQGQLHAPNALVAGFWPPPRAAEYDVIRKLTRRSQPLGQLADIFFGTHTGADDVFVLETIQEHGSSILVSSKATGERHFVEKAVLRPIVKDTRHLRRWYVDESGPYLLFPYRRSTNQLIEEADFADQYPQAWEYLQHPKVKNRLGTFWYGYSNPKNHEKLGSNEPRVITRTLAPYASFAPDVAGRLYFLDGAGGGYGVQPRDEACLPILFLLGLLNSKVLDFHLRQKSSTFRGGWWAYQKEYLKPLPIRVIDPGSPHDVKLHDSLVALVQRMLDLHQRLAAKGAAHDNEREQIEREIGRTDREIDDLVYDLYGLTAAERALIESEVRR